jgi:Rrf2 family protein
MRITTWAEYGLIASVHLAKRFGSRPQSARQLAIVERLPPDYVEQILLRLRRAGLVQSVRGARGGYSLSRAPQEITVREVVAASELGTFEVNCDVHPVDAERCGPSAQCSIRPVWRALQQRIDELLESVTLAELTHDEAEVVQLVGLAGGV